MVAGRRDHAGNITVITDTKLKEAKVYCLGGGSTTTLLRFQRRTPHGGRWALVCFFGGGGSL